MTGVNPFGLRARPGGTVIAQHKRFQILFKAFQSDTAGFLAVGKLLNLAVNGCILTELIEQPAVTNFPVRADAKAFGIQLFNPLLYLLKQGRVNVHPAHRIADGTRKVAVIQVFDGEQIRSELLEYGHVFLLIEFGEQGAERSRVG